jgi:hypothetical protein
MTVTVDPPTCTDDGYEDNDSAGAAVPLAAGSYPDLQVCASDDDYFSLSLDAGQSVQLDASFVDAEGDIDLLLQDPSGTVVASSLSFTDDEAITGFTASQTGDYTLQVDLWADAGSFPGTPYDLDIALPGCAPDPFEPDDSSLTATDTGSSPFTAYGRSLCSDSDVDWYERELSAGDLLIVDTYFEDAAGDIDIELYGPPSAAWIWGAYSETDDEVLLWSIADTGTHWIRVIFYADVAPTGNGYDISITHL